MANDDGTPNYKALQARRTVAQKARDEAAKTGNLCLNLEDFLCDEAKFPSHPPQAARSPLSPDHHPTRDFFIADILDASPKDDVASMENPIFALKAGDKRIRTYERRGVTITVKPGADGCATIHDKDLWIYCISQLVEANNRGRAISPTVRFTMYDFLVTTNRSTNGGKKGGYKLAEAMLARLKGTTIETNIQTAEKRERGFFGLIDSARLIERDGSERLVAVEVDLPSWLFRAVEAKQVLTLSRAYFRLRKPLDRRIYELARKHCGKQAKWSIGITTLHAKSGSASTIRRFRFDIKKLSESNVLPDYYMSFDSDRDMVTFFRRRSNNTQF